MDGPNVNWNVLNILDDKLESENFAKTFHQVFKIGFQKPSRKVDYLLKSAFWLLNDSPAQQDVYLTDAVVNTCPLRLMGLCWGCGLTSGLISNTV